MQPEHAVDWKASASAILLAESLLLFIYFSTAAFKVASDEIAVGVLYSLAAFPFVTAELNAVLTADNDARSDDSLALSK